MVTLALTGPTGAVEGALLSCFRDSGEPLVQVRVTGEADPAGAVERATRGRAVTTTVAVGREAGAVAARVLPPSTWSAVLLRGELDLSPRHPAKLEAFRAVAGAAAHLVLEDHWEMAKAATYESRLPHLRLPLLRAATSAPVLDGARARVAVLHDGADLAEALRPALEAACERQGAALEVLPVAGLYSARDLAAGRTLEQALRRRLGTCTHVVVLGDHRDTVAVVTTLAAQPGRVVVEGTLASTALAARLPGVVCARGTALVERLERALVAWRAEARPAPAPVRLLRSAGARLRRPAPQPSDVHGWFAALPGRSLPWFHEELWDDDEPAGELDVYFCVAPIENRANGARPQRVRNMAEAVVAGGPAVVVRPAEPLLERRTLLLDHLVDQGWRPRTVYGENSTSPMATNEVIDRVGALFSRLGEAGARRAWYVRDLHWLSPELLGGPPPPDLVERGLHELRVLSGATDLFLAPNEGSVREWQRLLGAHGVTHDRWDALPPALHPDNVCDIGGLAGGAPGLTVLYAGGTTGFYKQDVFLEAVAELSGDEGLRLDLVVPPTDADALRESLTGAGVVQGSTRVIVEDLSRYVPLTGEVVGVALFDGHYATHGFPFKTVSMLERGLHVLCFRDMAVADFLGRYEAAVLCDRDPASVVAAVRAYRSGHGRIRVHELLEAESWSARVDRLRDLLAAA